MSFDKTTQFAKFVDNLAQHVKPQVLEFVATQSDMTLSELVTLLANVTDFLEYPNTECFENHLEDDCIQIPRKLAKELSEFL